MCEEKLKSKLEYTMVIKKSDGQPFAIGLYSFCSECDNANPLKKGEIREYIKQNLISESFECKGKRGCLLSKASDKTYDSQLLDDEKENYGMGTIMTIESVTDFNKYKVRIVKFEEK